MSGSLHGACFSLCLCLCLSLYLSLINKFFKKRKKEQQVLAKQLQNNEGSCLGQADIGLRAILLPPCQAQGIFDLYPRKARTRCTLVPPSIYVVFRGPCNAADGHTLQGRSLLNFNTRTHSCGTDPMVKLVNKALSPNWHFMSS